MINFKPGLIFKINRMKALYIGLDERWLDRNSHKTCLVNSILTTRSGTCYVNFAVEGTDSPCTLGEEILRKIIWPIEAVKIKFKDLV